MQAAEAAVHHKRVIRVKDIAKAGVTEGEILQLGDFRNNFGWGSVGQHGSSDGGAP